MKKVLASFSIFVMLVISIGGCGIKGNPVVAGNVFQHVKTVDHQKVNIEKNNMILIKSDGLRSDQAGDVFLAKSGSEAQNDTHIYDLTADVRVDNKYLKERE